MLYSTLQRFRTRAIALALCLVAGIASAAQSDLIFSDGFEIGACITNAQCGYGKVCAAGFCAAVGSISLGGQCSANRDCSNGLYCSPIGVCFPAGGGQPGYTCTTGGDCTNDLTCSLYGLGATCSTGGNADLGDACTATSDCIAGLSCSAGGSCLRTPEAVPPFAGVACAPDAAPFRVYFEVPRPGVNPADFFRLPFPNDARINADGTLNLTDFPRPGTSLLGFDIADRYANALSTDFSGFSSLAGVTFRFSQELDFNTTGATSVHYIDITNPAEVQFGTDRGRAWSYDTGTHVFVCQNAFVVSPVPSQPLRAAGIYAVYLTTALHSTSAAVPVQDPDLVALLAASAPSDPTLARAWLRYANFRAYLLANNIAASQIAAAAVFQVQDSTAKMRALHAAVEAQPPPVLSDLTLCDGATASPCAIDGDPARVCGDSAGSFWEIHGRMTIPNFQQGTLPYEFPADGGEIAFDSGGTPVSAGTLNVCFALSVPKSIAPASGWPLVVHAHGTDGSFRSAIDNGIATALATATSPMATLTFEGVGHGARRGSSTRPLDGLVFNVFNPAAARDNHLQGAVDVLQALRVAQVSPVVPSGPGSIVFDPTRVYFFGDTQGSNVGLPAIAMSTRVPAVILSGSGSDLVKGILTRTSPTDARTVIEYLLHDDSVTEQHPLMALWQSYFDPIDPVNYAALVLAQPPPGVASKHVYLPWGQGDTYSSDAVMSITAQAMGLQLAEPVLVPIFGLAQVARPVSANRLGGDGVLRTAACFQYAPDIGYDGHFVSTQNPAAIADWIAFLVSHAQSGTPLVP